MFRAAGLALNELSNAANELFVYSCLVGGPVNRTERILSNGFPCCLGAVALSRKHICAA
jgi:hypothetical protein